MNKKLVALCRTVPQRATVQVGTLKTAIYLFHYKSEFCRAVARAAST
jgi:hypothetical protein